MESEFKMFDEYIHRNVFKKFCELQSIWNKREEWSEMYAKCGFSSRLNKTYLVRRENDWKRQKEKWKNFLRLYCSRFRTFDVVHAQRWKMKFNQQTTNMEACIVLHRRNVWCLSVAFCFFLFYMSLFFNAIAILFSCWIIYANMFCQCTSYWCALFLCFSIVIVVIVVVVVFSVLFSWDACDYVADDMSKVKTLLNNERSQFSDFSSHVLFLRQSGWCVLISMELLRCAPFFSVLLCGHIMTIHSFLF